MKKDKFNPYALDEVAKARGKRKKRKSKRGMNPYTGGGLK